MNWISLTALALLLLIWEGAARLLSVPSYILPAPTLIAAQITSNLSVVLSNTGVTALEAVLGAVVGCAVGLVLGRLMAVRRWAQSLFLPYIVGSNAIPVVAIAPLVALWFGNGLTGKVVVAAFLCFFPIAINTYDGLRERNETYKELFRVLGAPPGFYFWNLRVPLAIPRILSGAKVSVVLAVIGAVVAEFVGSNSGLGFGMVQASYTLDTPRLFGYMIIAGALGLAFYGAVAGVEMLLRHSQRWMWAFGAGD